MLGKIKHSITRQDTLGNAGTSSLLAVAVSASGATCPSALFALVGSQKNSSSNSKASQLKLTANQTNHIQFTSNICCASHCRWPAHNCYPKRNSVCWQRVMVQLLVAAAVVAIALELIVAGSQIALVPHTPHHPHDGPGHVVHAWLSHNCWLGSIQVRCHRGSRAHRRWTGTRC